MINIKNKLIKSFKINFNLRFYNVIELCGFVVLINLVFEFEIIF